MKIPFFNLSREIQQHKNEFLLSMSKTLDSSNFILGKQTKLFESSFANYIGVKHCAGVNSGLDALIFALKACDIKAGDEVIVPAHTFIATWLAVTSVNAKIIPVEPDESYNISQTEILNKISPKTKAIIIVHLYGRPFDVLSLKQSLLDHPCHIIEDAAQAHGSSINGHMCGAMGAIGAFSFYPTKSLGAFGDGGAIVTNSSQYNTKIKSIRNYGSSKKYHHDDIGYNSRLDEIQAGILTIKLKQLEKTIADKRKIASFYQKNLLNEKITTPIKESPNSKIAWHQFVLKTRHRENFISHMEKNGIGTMIHYPIPPHKSNAYTKIAGHLELTKTEFYSNSLVSIPIYPTLTEREVSYIVDVINEF